MDTNINFKSRKLVDFFKKNKGKKLLLINTRSPLGDLCILLKNALLVKANNFHIVLFASRIPDILQDFKKHITLCGELLEKNDFKEIDDFVFKKISRTWYRYKMKEAGGIEIADYLSLNLGEIIEFELQLYLLARLKNFVISKRAIESYTPDNIFIIDDTTELDTPVCYLTDKMHIKSISMVTKYDAGYTFRANQPLLFYKILELIDSYMVKKVLTFRNLNLKIIDERIYNVLTKNVELNNRKDIIPGMFIEGLKERVKYILSDRIYVPFSQNHRASKRHMKEFKKRWSVLSDDEEFRKLFMFRKDSIWEFVKDKLCSIFNEEFPKIATYVDRIDKMLKRGNIKLITLRHDVRVLERMIISVARRNKVSTLVVQHGLWGENGQDIIFADKLAVWGGYVARSLKSYGNPDSKIVITGNPVFDIWKKKEKILCRNNDIRSQLKIPPNRKIVTAISQVVLKTDSHQTDDEMNCFMLDFIKSAKYFPEYSFILKLHPCENIATESLFKVHRTSRSNIIAVRNFDIFELLAISDLVIISSSTTGLETNLLKRPVIMYKINQRDYSFAPFEEYGAAVTVRSYEELIDAIRKIFDDGDYYKNHLFVNSQRFINDYLSNRDSSASENILSVIEGMVK